MLLVLGLPLTPPFSHSLFLLKNFLFDIHYFYRMRMKLRIEELPSL